ncbi:MAG: patatin [Acidobacteria bacterium]|nr:MAG: patatin [Acidobacteriota bacterium]
MTSYPFQNLVFEGGGVKGIAYLGALQVLDEKNILKQIRRIGGTSAGAINAVLLALGYTLDEMQEILTGLDFHNFMDSSWGIIRDTDRLLTKFGWYKGDFFRKWMGQLIEKKTGNPHSTFNDFAQHDFPALYLVGTNLSTGFSEVFSVEHTPRMPVADAARISMSIPLFFTAVRNFRGDVFVDGGVFNNYPVKLFDREKYIDEKNRNSHARETDYYNKVNVQRPDNSSPYVYNRETLGFRLDTREEIAMFRDSAEPPHHKIDDFFDYGKSLIHAVLNVQSNQHIHSDDWHRTVYIDTLGVETTDFDISNEKKKALFKQGIASTKHYFDWFDKADPADMPVNRPENR